MLVRDALGELVLGGLRLSDLVSGERGGAVPTPFYAYDLGAIEREAKELIAGFGAAPHLVAYAVKANSAGPIVETLARAGCGADVVSGGELALALEAGVAPDKIVYSGVAKRDDELDRAIGAGERGILGIQIESVEEIGRIAARARAAGKSARVSIRINPGIEVDTHAHVATGHDEAKFGVPVADLGEAWAALASAPEVLLVGLSSHIGSQLMSVEPYVTAAETLLCVARERESAGHRFELFDFGGGFGVDYGGAKPLPPAEYARAAVRALDAHGFGGRLCVVEPGRALTASFGVLCSRVLMQKHASSGGEQRRWVMIDAGMNDLLRPALYQAKHRIEPMRQDAGGGAPSSGRVVGPVCESSDDFGAHLLPDPLPSHVVIRDAGAYGFTMASEYNGRALPREVFIRDGEVVGVLTPRSEADWVAGRLLPRGPEKR